MSLLVLVSAPLFELPPEVQNLRGLRVQRVVGMALLVSRALQQHLGKAVISFSLRTGHCWHDLTRLPTATATVHAVIHARPLAPTTPHSRTRTRSPHARTLAP